MHRKILKVPASMFVDHINHNGLDNREANLRPATRAQNARNRRKDRESQLPLKIQRPDLVQAPATMGCANNGRSQLEVHRLFRQRNRRRKSLRQSRKEVPRRIRRIKLQKIVSASPPATNDILFRDLLLNIHAVNSESLQLFIFAFYT